MVAFVRLLMPDSGPQGKTVSAPQAATNPGFWKGLGDPGSLADPAQSTSLLQRQLAPEARVLYLKAHGTQ